MQLSELKLYISVVIQIAYQEINKYIYIFCRTNLNFLQKNVIYRRAKLYAKIFADNCIFI